MANIQEQRNLACEIGLCRIALVVDRVHRGITAQPMLTKLFCVTSDNDSQQIARLTYFWWVVLGGKRLQHGDLELQPGGLSAGNAPLQDWLVVFRAVALPIIGDEFTRAWMAKAERLGPALSGTERGCLQPLAKAS